MQRAWMFARTRESAFQLFSIVTGFIQQRPEIGPAMYDAFVWVDNFLNG
jgi:hypothetical protein